MRTDQKLFCLKTLLTIFLSLLWLVGAGIFGVLLWLRLDFWTNEYTELDSSLDRYLNLVYITLAAGGVIVLFSILGLLGGCCKNKWLLGIYLVAILMAMALTISAVVYGIIYREELEDTLVRGDFLEKVVQGKYVEDSTSRYTRVVDIMQSELLGAGLIVVGYLLRFESALFETYIMDIMTSAQVDGVDLKSVFQSVSIVIMLLGFIVMVFAAMGLIGGGKKLLMLECCGANSPTDYTLSQWGRDHAGHAPASCCRAYQRDENRSKLCKMFKLQSDQELTDDIWKDGCNKPLYNFFKNYIIVVIIIASVYFVLQLVCMIITSVLIHVLRSLYVPQPDDIVYDMAHNQEKSPYPSRGDYRDYYH